MKHVRCCLSLCVVLGLAITAARTTHAAEVLVGSDLSTSITWTAHNVYNLQKQIYVLPGATLNIEAGTLIRSTSGLGGSLAVCRGARIYVNGTKDRPVVMTSSGDNLTSWHEGCNEWGNLTLMGNALISGSHYGGVAQSYQDGATASIHSNTKLPDGMNKKQMEGLTAAFPGDPKVLYGGSDDDDNSGALHYLSLRYGGKVIGLANELNGLSMGAIGRETDVDHIDIMNNVDDGIETWGGTVNYKYVNIWNIGDDSFDFDEGWRGKAQFGLIVQGYSINAPQGSGVGDNCLETDGAEDSDAQPVTTGVVYNFTVVGQPIDGDQGTAWRDNCRMQYHNMIFMNLGEELVKKDNVDGDGAHGYGYNGTLSWEDTWRTPYTATSGINAGTADPAVLYRSQISGNLAEITDSVFFANNFSKAYTEADARGVRDATQFNVTAAISPIAGLTRGASATKGGKIMLPVASINPCAAHDALVSAARAPEDGFFTPVGYRGGFSADYNWLAGWTAVDAYGMTDTSMNSGVKAHPTGDLNADGVVDDLDLLKFATTWHQNR